MAVEEDEAERKQTEHKRVFFGFGDDLAVDPNLHRAVRLRRKTRTPEKATTPIIEGSRKEVADGFVEDAGARPSRSLPAGIGESASGDTNPHVISSGIIIQEKVGNGSAAAADGDCRRIGGVGGESDVGFAASGNSGQHRVSVCGVGAGKQGRKLKVGVAGLVGVKNVSGIGREQLPTVSINVSIRA